MSSSPGGGGHLKHKITGKRHPVKILSIGPIDEKSTISSSRGVTLQAQNDREATPSEFVPRGSETETTDNRTKPLQCDSDPTLRNPALSYPIWDKPGVSQGRKIALAHPTAAC